MSKWSKNPAKLVEKIKKDHVAKVCLTALNVHQRIVQKTPVDTGRARSNWLPSIGSPATGTVGVSRSLAVQARRVFNKKSVPFGTNLYIANNLPYIERLNQGYSKQAPMHFVEMAIQEVKNEL